jgi:large subunit ribosomal protein L22
MKVTAKLKNIRIAPRKSRLVANLIKGMNVNEALYQLDIQVKRTSPYMKKLLESAIANGENNFGLDRNNLYVFDARVNAGPSLKRWMPKAFGRAGQILKRTTNIDLVLEERVEGKGRKTKEEMEKERNLKLKEKEKAEKERLKEEKKSDKEKAKEEKISDKSSEMKKENEPVKKESKKKGWAKKIFQRKSM